ncbi:MAG: hypothetical protein AAAFM81_11665 [Pseudomonadota bacterium]
MYMTLRWLIGAILALAAQHALAAEYWGSCDGCRQQARNFAMGIPPDAMGTSRVNIYDNTTEALSTFAVTVYFDYEFRNWSRFAQRVPSSTQATAAVDIVKSGYAAIDRFQDIAEPIIVPIPSSRDFVASNGRYDELVSQTIFESIDWDESFWQRAMNTSVAILANAASVIKRGDSDPAFLVRFEDGSTIEIQARFVIDGEIDITVQYVDDSARLADGTRLPDEPKDINNYVVVTPERDQAIALVHWVNLIAGVPTHMIDVPPIDSSGYQYIFRCSETDCVLIATRDAT